MYVYVGGVIVKDSMAGGIMNDEYREGRGRTGGEERRGEERRGEERRGEENV